MKFYISSTYSDLKNEREKAAHAIRRLGHQAIAMEDYVATDERPLEKCLEDVRNCDAYIGIFAWRYGYKPENYKKSITHLEYEEAGKAGIDRLLFVLKEDAPWPRTKMDDDCSPIKGFRESLSKDHLISYFSTPEGLASEVTAAISNLPKKEESKPEIRTSTHNHPPVDSTLLPYLSNRKEQEFEVAEALEKHLKDRRRQPFVCFLHGNENEAHDTFITRLKSFIAKTINPSGDEGPITSYYVEWPVIKDISQFNKRFCSNLAERIIENRMASVEDIHNTILLHNEPVIIKTHILSENWGNSGAECLDEFLRFWNEWPTLAPNNFLMICWYIKYQDYKSQGLWKARKIKKLNNAIRNFLNELKLELNNFAKISSIILSELPSVSKEDVEKWLEDDNILDFKKANEYTKQKRFAKIRELFEKSEHLTDNGLIPMEYLAPELSRLLEA